MTGMEISKIFYTQYVQPMLERDFASERKLIAVGLSGQGSECLGFDDELSRDHDFGPGVCLWIPQSEAGNLGARLAAAYNSLPQSIPECETSAICTERSGRVGVLTIEGFYKGLIGRQDAPKNCIDWLRIPQCYLSQACSGEVFSDPLGSFSAVRNTLLNFYPDDVLKKKLAANCAGMAQSGQYNYGRSVKRKDFGAAYLAGAEFIHHALAALYLLNGRYMPFYKWAFRGTADFSCLPECAGKLRALTSMPDLPLHRQKLELIEEVCKMISSEIIRRSWSDNGDTFMQYHAGMLMESISDEHIRRLPVMYGG